VLADPVLADTVRAYQYWQRAATGLVRIVTHEAVAACYLTAARR
jgi:hypothetical protein